MVGVTTTMVVMVVVVEGQRYIAERRRDAVWDRQN